MAGYKYFKMREFRCPMAKTEKMSHEFVQKLDKARGLANTPFRITSGWRSPEYQEDLRKRGYHTATGQSPHEKGVAADIFVKNDDCRSRIFLALQEVGFNRFGNASNFIHVDSDFVRNPNRIWHFTS